MSQRRVGGGRDPEQVALGLWPGENSLSCLDNSNMPLLSCFNGADTLMLASSPAWAQLPLPWPPEHRTPPKLLLPGHPWLSKWHHCSPSFLS